MSDEHIYRSRAKLEDLFKEIDELWAQYRSRAKDAIEEWDKSRVELLEKISLYVGFLTSIERELEELTVMVELGLLSKEKVSEKMEYLFRRREELKLKINELKETLEQFEKWALTHRKRIGPITTISGEEELRSKLEELERLKERGTIDEKTYKRLKNELEALLAIFKE